MIYVSVKQLVVWILIYFIESKIVGIHSFCQTGVSFNFTYILQLSNNLLPVGVYRCFKMSKTLIRVEEQGLFLNKLAICLSWYLRN
jgi:hypothetical protein